MKVCTQKSMIAAAPSGVKVVAANSSSTADAEFIAIAIRDAERCHTGIGMYDVLVGTDRILQDTNSAANSKATPISEAKSSAGESDRDSSCIPPQQDIVSRFVQHVAEHDYNAHIHISRFLIVKDAVTEEPLAAGCAFPYPEYSVMNSKPGINAALKAVCGFDDTAIEQAWQRLSFFSECWPAIDCDGTWSIDAVYVSPVHRGRSLGALITKELMREQQLVAATTTDTDAATSAAAIGAALSSDIDAKDDCNNDSSVSLCRIQVGANVLDMSSLGDRDCILACAVGNTSARRLYERIGFISMGEGSSDNCIRVLGTPGFAILRAPAAVVT